MSNIALRRHALARRLMQHRKLGKHVLCLKRAVRARGASALIVTQGGPLLVGQVLKMADQAYLSSFQLLAKARRNLAEVSNSKPPSLIAYYKTLVPALSPCEVLSSLIQDDKER